MEIKNLQVYGLKESLIRSGYPHQTGEPDNHEDHLLLATTSNTWSRVHALANNPIGSGHNNFLIGITVQFDLKYPQYWTKHLQRYHWFQYFSGQSIMHSITKIKDIKGHCNKYVLDHSIQLVNTLIHHYNNPEDKWCGFGEYREYEAIAWNSKEELFQYIISNIPMGYELWIPVTTNYMQLKTMYYQRRTHRLQEWQEFCNWIEKLPMSTLITKTP